METEQTNVIRLEDIEAHFDYAIRMEEFIKSLLNPDMFGHAVSAEVRDEARHVLGKRKVETT